MKCKLYFSPFLFLHLSPSPRVGGGGYYGELIFCYCNGRFLVQLRSFRSMSSFVARYFNSCYLEVLILRRISGSFLFPLRVGLDSCFILFYFEICGVWYVFFFIQWHCVLPSFRLPLLLLFLIGDVPCLWTRTENVACL